MDKGVKDWNQGKRLEAIQQSGSWYIPGVKGIKILWSFKDDTKVSSLCVLEKIRNSKKQPIGNGRLGMLNCIGIKFDLILS